jgi:hypothetical protein
MSHPLNWLIIFSMLFVLMFTGHLLISFFTGQHPGADATAPTAPAGPGTATPVFS